jgi:CHAD domain-containing protein
VVTASEIVPEGQALLDLPLAVAGARVMLEQLERLAAHEAGARTGEDPEDVHRMRVATRRLRAARRVFQKALAGLVDLDRANAESKTLATALGRVRDLDVFAAALRGRAQEAPPGDRAALERLAADHERERDAARAGLIAVLDGGSLAYLRGELRRELEAVAGGAEPPRRGAGRRKDTVARGAPRLVARALRRLRRAGDDLLAPPSYELHELRITAKRARYTGEFFAPGYGDLLKGPIARLTDVQDTLGEVHDADVAAAVLLRAIERIAGQAGQAGEPASDGQAGQADGAGELLAPAGEAHAGSGAAAQRATGEGVATGAPSRAADAGPIARLVARYLAERDDRLLTFREQWDALPRPNALRRRLRRSGPSGSMPPGQGPATAQGTRTAAEGVHRGGGRRRRRQ